MDALQSGFPDAFASLAYAFEASTSASSSAQAAFQWGGTIFDFEFVGIFNFRDFLPEIYVPEDFKLCIIRIHRSIVRFLLILNRFGLDSRTQSTLLVLYLFISLPEVLFKILREQFGCWVAFLAIVANMFFPHTFPVPVSRFLLFVIAPNWIAHGLRNSMVGGVFCLVIGIAIVIVEIRGNGGFRNCSCNFRCFAYYLCIAFLFCFTILYLCLGNW